MTIITRFAPSPTGSLHLGSARTALFNYLYARHTGGQFLLRIEDTDKARSTDASRQAILDGMTWLGLDYDGAIVYQSANAARHQAVAETLLATGHAYRCYCTAEDLQARRAANRGGGYDRRCRDCQPQDKPYTIRLKIPLDGETVIDDAVQGQVRVANAELDDFVLLRADGTPTYMLAVVVDDHDMGVTHIIRGDDHLNNAFRQQHLFAACGFGIPTFAHIPLIHGHDGGKLSKRHGATDVSAYQAMGILPEAMRVYLARLGWSYGDQEFFSPEELTTRFDLPGINRAPARFDLEKLLHINAHYLKALPDDQALSLLETGGFLDIYPPLTAQTRAWLRAGLADLIERSPHLGALAEAARIYLAPTPLPLADKAANKWDTAAQNLVGALIAPIGQCTPWDHQALFTVIAECAQNQGLKTKQAVEPLRIALTGDIAGPSVFAIAETLGRKETLRRLQERL